MKTLMGLVVAFACALVLLTTIPHSAGGGALVSIFPEVVVASGVLADGESIPLPSYSDGTMASPSECTWMVSLNTLSGNNEAIQDIHCSADMNRTISCTGIDIDERPLTGQANYVIIAVRPAQGVAVQNTTWGSVKSRFADIKQ